jgi:hypothetical protein
MAKIIKFPNTPMNELSSAQKLAMEMETEKNQVELEIEWNMNRKDWDKIPHIDGRSLEVLALFGDVMKFNPQTASRLISKLAETIKRNETYDPLEEYQ